MLLELAQGFGLVTPDPFSSRELGGVWERDYSVPFPHKVCEWGVENQGRGKWSSHSGDCFVSQMFQSAAEVLKFIMAGFGVQEEPYFTEKLNDSVTSLFKALKDPSLPLMEMQVCVCVCVCVWGGGYGSKFILTHLIGADVGHFKSHPLFSGGSHTVISCSLR